MAAVKGYYRLIDQPEDSALTKNILAPHREHSLRRMKAQPTVLCIQDGTDLNYTSQAQSAGRVLGSNQTGAPVPGLHLHSTLAITTEGLPLGVWPRNARPRSPSPSATIEPSGAIRSRGRRPSAGSRGCATAPAWPPSCPKRWSA